MVKTGSTLASPIIIPQTPQYCNIVRKNIMCDMGLNDIYIGESFLDAYRIATDLKDLDKYVIRYLFRKKLFLCGFSKLRNNFVINYNY